MHALLNSQPGKVALSAAPPPGIQMVVGSILRSSKTLFHGDRSWNHFYGHFLPTADSSKGSCRMCTKYWLTT